MAGTEASIRTVVRVPGMDCTAEEAMVRAALRERPSVRSMSFDLEARSVRVVHAADDELVAAIGALGFGAELIETGPVDRSDERALGGEASEGPALEGERRVLRQVLAINAAMFVAEMIVGWIAASTGLLADSLDMFADAAVYAISLYVVGRGSVAQQRAATLSGAVQLVLALGMLFEVGRRALFGSEPSSVLMMGMAAVALAANLACVALLRRFRDGRAHMRASWIFTTSDALANLGVLAAGLLVAITGSAIPDLVIGAVIAVVVLRSAVRILRLR